MLSLMTLLLLPLLTLILIFFSLSQIWFQNRRAKLRRSLRETRLQLVQSAVADLGVRHARGEQELAQRLASRLQLEVDEGEE